MPRSKNTIWDLLSKVDSEGGLNACWPYLGKIQLNGYAHIRRGQRKTVKAHRWVYEHFYNVSLEGLVVMHLCDNRACCNPMHLKAGTQKENMLDMVLKNRKKQFCYDTVKQLKESGMTQKQIADKLGCSWYTVWRILKKQKTIKRDLENFSA